MFPMKLSHCLLQMQRKQEKNNRKTMLNLTYFKPISKANWNSLFENVSQTVFTIEINSLTRCSFFAYFMVFCLCNPLFMKNMAWNVHSTSLSMRR